MKSSRVILCAAGFAVVEALAIIYAMWPALFKQAQVHKCEIRLGIVAAVSKTRSFQEWEAFLDDFSKSFDCSVKPYFANSHEEAISGLVNGSLDLLYANPAVFISLNNKYKLKAWLYHRLSRREKDQMRAILVCSKPVSYITGTKGLRMTFTDPNSMTGCIVPMRFLEEKLPCKPAEWFSSVSYAHSEAAAFESLLADETDIVACDNRSLEDALSRHGERAKGLQPIWMSISLPENVICSLDILPEEMAGKLKRAREEISSRPLREEFLTERSMVFLPPDHSFNESLTALQRYLEGPKTAQPKIPATKPE